MRDIQNKGGLKFFKNPKQLGAKNFFFLTSVTSTGFHEGKSQKRELIPKPSLEVPCPFLRLKEKKEERSKRTVVDINMLSGRFDRSR